MKISNLLFLAAILFLIASCKEELPPKPKGWNRIDLPERDYQSLGKNRFPYEFEISKHAEANLDTTGFYGPYWLNINYPEMGARIPITYYSVQDSAEKLAKLIEDTHKLASKHQVKAYSVQKGNFETESGKIAGLFKLEGDVPSQMQFYITDSVNHFLRGALYFKTATANDSLAPVIDYIAEDMIHMINTLKWKEEKEG